MKLMKKLSAGLLTLAMCTAMTATAFAEEAKTTFNLYVPNDPTYTITVPATVDVSATEVTKVPVTASDVKYIPEGKKVSVTYKYGNGTSGRFYLVGENPEGVKDYLMTMEIKGTDGEFKSGALDKQIKGMELAAFTEDGTVEYETYPCAFDYPNGTGNLAIQKGVAYSGWMTYGIELVDIPAAE